MLLPLHYKIIYRNGDNKAPIEIADFWRTDEGQFIFKYRENPKYEFPGFKLKKSKYESDNLWEHISFRVSNVVRKQNPDRPLEELLALNNGKLVTDHFEFISTND